MSEFESEMIRIGDIHPNPYRQLATYGLIESKLTELMASIKDTGFWPNVIGRRNDQGKIEIAYGHHRLEACRRYFGEDHLLPVHIQNIDDHMMLQIMASENSDDWANPTQHVRMCVTAAIRELEAALDIGSYKVASEDPNIEKAFNESATVYEAADIKGVTPDMVGRYLGEAWLRLRKRGEAGRNDDKEQASEKITKIWPLLKRTDRMKAALKARIEELRHKATVEANRAQVAPRKATRDAAAAAAEKAEKELIQLEMEEAHEDGWSDEIIDQFASTKLASTFKKLILGTDEGRDLLDTLGGDWDMLLRSINQTLINADGEKGALSRNDNGQICDSSLASKMAAATGATLDGILDPTADESEAAIAYEMMKRLETARKKATATSSSVARCATWAEKHKLSQRASMHYRVLTGELKKIELAANRLQSAIDGIDFGDKLTGNVIEGEFINGK